MLTEACLPNWFGEHHSMILCHESINCACSSDSNYKVCYSEEDVALVCDDDVVVETTTTTTTTLLFLSSTSSTTTTAIVSEQKTS